MDELVRLMGTAGDGSGLPPILAAVMHVFSFSTLHLALLSTLAGGALLTAALFPEGLRLALGGLDRRPLASWALGSVVLALLSGGLVALLTFGVRPGRGLLSFTLVLGVCAGTAVSARWLGERLAGEATPLLQLLLGVVIAVLCLGSPFGLPVLALLAPCGLGAFLLAGRGGGTRL